MNQINIDMLRIKLFERPFRKLTLDDKSWVEQACAEDAGISTHVNFLTMMQCQEMYAFDSFRKVAGCVVKRPWVDDGKWYCQYPIGLSKNRKKAIKKIVKLYSKQNSKFVFFGVSEDSLKEIQEIFGDKISNVENDRDSQEYILDVKEQINLEEAQFANRRSKINRFHRRFHWTCEKITSDNMEECISVNSDWCNGYENAEVAARQQAELKAILKNYDALNYRGELFRIDGKPVAFCIGAPFNDKIFMNIFMKADNSYRDITIAFLHEFMKRNCAEYSYANDGCDMGVPGLRSFKTNLHPKFLTPSYFVTVNTQA